MIGYYGPFDFSSALIYLKAGYYGNRTGWNGKDIYIKLHAPVGEVTEPFFVIVAKDKVNTWVPSVSDLLGEDWIVFLKNQH